MKIIDFASGDLFVETLRDGDNELWKFIKCGHVRTHHNLKAE